MRSNSAMRTYLESRYGLIAHATDEPNHCFARDLYVYSVVLSYGVELSSPVVLSCVLCCCAIVLF